MITEVFLYVGQPLLRAFCAECRVLIHLPSHATLSRDQHDKEVYTMIFFSPMCVYVLVLFDTIKKFLFSCFLCLPLISLQN